MLLQKDETILQSVIAQPILDFMNDRDFWEGTASELMKLLESQEFGIISGYGTDEKQIVKNIPKWWIKSPAEFGKQMSRIAFALEYEGLNLDRNPENRKGHKRVLRLKKVSFAKSPVTPVIQRNLYDEGKA